MTRKKSGKELKKIDEKDIKPHKMNWLDARLYQPESHSCCGYLVLCKSITSIDLDIAYWRPDNGYENGRWDIPEDKEVLFWAENRFTVPKSVTKFNLGDTSLKSTLASRMLGVK